MSRIGTKGCSVDRLPNSLSNLSKIKLEFEVKVLWKEEYWRNGGRKKTNVNDVNT